MKKHSHMIVEGTRNPKYRVEVWNYNPTRAGIGKTKNPAPLTSRYHHAWDVVDQIELIVKLNPRWEIIRLFNEKGEMLKEWRNKNIGT